MKIGILGGTFNPIHNAHLNLAREFMQKLALDRMSIVPTYLPPHKSGKDLLNAQDRLEMCRLAVRNEKPPYHVSEYEIKQEGKSYTYRTLMHIQEKYPGAELFLLMGGDMFLTVQDWRRAEDIYRLATLCAIQREKGELTLLDMHKDILETRGARCLLLDIEAQPLSSTFVRQKIEQGEDVFAYLHPDVWAYIKEKGLYRKAEKA